MCNIKLTSSFLTTRNYLGSICDNFVFVFTGQLECQKWKKFTYIILVLKKLLL